MGESTFINFTEHTFNPWLGCTKVGGSPACDNCYAERFADFLGYKVWGADAPRHYFGNNHWNKPLFWNRDARVAGKSNRVFCASMADWAEGKPEQRPHLDRLWGLIKATPWLDWLMLTKRPQLIPTLYPTAWQENPMPNVWMGTTTETQAWLDNRWPFLRDIPAAIHWLSIEPLFEQITLPDDFLALGSRAWCVVGGESGPNPRVTSPDCVRRLRDQCVEAGVPFHFKQWGEWGPEPQDGLARPNYSRLEIDGHQMLKLGKYTAGCDLDGRIWEDRPPPRTGECTALPNLLHTLTNPASLLMKGNN